MKYQKSLGGSILAGCRLVPYKRIDIVVEAFKRNGKNLKVFGDGIDLERLQEIADGADNIKFLGRVSDEERKELFSKCQAYINPQQEDFGITIVEAMASGRPVIALGKGGATETIKEGETGLFFASENSFDIEKAVERFESEKYSWDSGKIREHALKFSKDNFKQQIKAFIERKYEAFKNEQ